MAPPRGSLLVPFCHHSKNSLNDTFDTHEGVFKKLATVRASVAFRVTEQDIRSGMKQRHLPMNLLRFTSAIPTHPRMK